MSIPELDSYMILYKLNPGTYKSKASYVSTRKFTVDSKLDSSQLEFIPDPLLNTPVNDRTFTPTSI